MLKLFRSRSDDRTQTAPPPTDMRGRATEISDPATLGWEVVWEALKTEPPGLLTKTV